MNNIKYILTEKGELIPDYRDLFKVPNQTQKPRYSKEFYDKIEKIMKFWGNHPLP